MPSEAGTAASGLTIERVTSDRAVELREAWLRLRERATDRAFTADPDVFDAVLSDMPGAQGWLLGAFAGGDCRGLLVGRARKARSPIPVLRWRVGLMRLRTLDVVRGGVLEDGTPGVLAALLNDLSRRLRAGEIDVAVFHHVRADGEASRLIGGLLRARIRVDRPNWRLELTPGDAEASLARAWTARHRKERRREERRLREHAGGELELRAFTGPGEIGAFVGPTEELAGRTWQTRVGTGSVFRATARWRRIMECEAERGRLLCYWLVAGGVPIAYQVGFVHGGTYFWEATGFDPSLARLSPGQVLMAMMFRDLALRGVREVDFGLGDNEYKRRVGTVCHSMATFTVYGGGARARSAGVLHRCAAGMNAGVEALSKRLVWMDALRRTARPGRETGPTRR